jgi:hypothetical protein
MYVQSYDLELLLASAVQYFNNFGVQIPSIAQKKVYYISIALKCVENRTLN